MSRNAIPWRTIEGRGDTVMPLLDTHIDEPVRSPGPSRTSTWPNCNVNALPTGVTDVLRDRTAT